MPAKTDVSSDYCSQQARQLDYDRYLATLFAPSDKRPALAAILSWNLEVAKTRDSVSEPMLGHIRLQWWREAIAEIYGGGDLRQHPVVTTIADAVDRYSLSRASFETLLNARETDMEDSPHERFEEFEAYAKDTSAPIFSLCVQVLGARADSLETEISSLGIAWALTGILRAVPYNAARRRCWLPLESLRNHGVTLEDLFAPRKKEALVEVFRLIAGQAEKHLNLVHEGYKRVPKAARPAFLPAVLARAYLKNMCQNNYDLTRIRVDISPLGKQLRVMGARWLTGI